jgi:DMSO/TMAO reductase YedYZ molybdopterin-dependent catalytic subunit
MFGAFLFGADHRHGGGKWRLIVSGGGMEELSVSMKAIKKLGVRTYSVDWHCVTGWSYPGLKLQG